MVAKLTRLTHKNSATTAPSGRELYHLQFWLQAASPETFGHTLVRDLPTAGISQWYSAGIWAG
jgi:hypothetical protein